jgi:ketosteroid isomerase-like protein
MAGQETYSPITDPQHIARELAARAEAKDSQGIALLYEPDAVLAVDAGQVVRGRQAIADYFGKILAAGFPVSLGEQRPVIISGDLAMTSTRLPNGQMTTEIARRQPDGSWLWVIDQPTVA